MAKANPEPARPLAQFAWLFLKLGTINFGGPAAHIAMMEDEVVRRRHWLPHEEFLDLLGATNLIPGPNSTEMAIHVGHRRAGFPGLLVARACFIFPAMLIVMGVRGGISLLADCLTDARGLSAELDHGLDLRHSKPLGKAP